jgi:GNAT superfamily N-acetyltransferase
VPIRLAEPEELPALQQIEVRAGERFIEIGMPEIAAHPPPELDELAGAAAVLVAVPDEGGEPVGYAVIELVDDETHLQQISVLPELGGQGVGTVLLEAVVDWARARGDAAVTLTTFRDVAFNGPLYERRGFRHVPEDQWTPALRAIIAAQAAMGMDPATRTVMRRAVT